METILIFAKNKLNPDFTAQNRCAGLPDETIVPTYNEVVFAVLFISYMVGITLFTHSHVVNGVTIVHSHPFKKGSEHSHTTVEFQLIHLLNHVLVTDSGLIPTFAVAALSLLCILFIRPQVEPYHRSCPGVISLRAPPVA